MIKIYVKKQSNYPVKATVLKDKLRRFLEQKGIVSDSVVNISLVSEKKMLQLSYKFLNEKDKLHNVLSFPGSETKREFVYPDDVIQLGEIVVCYPVAFEEAKKGGILIEDKVYELVEHGARHLLGEHHD